uniref:Uncharacterized protein n=1 Tax=Megaselia scalaris TaxID=36166 RepID=T1GKZ9_MEGSC
MTNVMHFINDRLTKCWNYVRQQDSSKYNIRSPGVSLQVVRKHHDHERKSNKPGLILLRLEEKLRAYLRALDAGMSTVCNLRNLQAYLI